MRIHKKLSLCEYYNYIPTEKIRTSKSTVHKVNFRQKKTFITNNGQSYCLK